MNDAHPDYLVRLYWQLLWDFAGQDRSSLMIMIKQLRDGEDIERLLGWLPEKGCVFSLKTIDEVDVAAVLEDASSAADLIDFGNVLILLNTGSIPPADPPYGPTAS